MSKQLFLCAVVSAIVSSIVSIAIVFAISYYSDDSYSPAFSQSVPITGSQSSPVMLAELPPNISVKTHYSSLVVDQEGKCWISLNSKIYSEASSHQDLILVTRKPNGFEVAIPQKEREWTKVSNPDKSYAPVISLRLIP